MLRKYLNVSTVTWALLHVILVLFGFLVLHWPAASKYLGDEIAAGVGVSILSTGVVGLFLFLYVMLSETTRSRLNALSEAGIDGVFSHRSVRIKSEYDRRLAGAKRIDVLGYGLGSMMDDYAVDFAKWSQQARVRLVVVNPNNHEEYPSFADLRDREEGRTPGRTAADVRRLTQEIATNSGINKSRFELRFMRAIPSINIMIIDDEIFWGPYLLERQSRNTFTMTVRRGGYMYEALESHFEELWKNYTVPTSLVE